MKVSVFQWPVRDLGDQALAARAADFNPIEQLFAKLKALLRKAAERTVDSVCQRIGKLLDDFPAKECANYLKNAGYAST